MHLTQSLLVVLSMLQYVTSSSTGRNNGSAETHPRCVTGVTGVTDGSIIKCTLEETDIIGPDPIKLGVMAGQTVEVYTACQQNGSEGFKCICYQRINSTMQPLHHFVRDENGLYSVICGNYSITVTSAQSRPSVPVLRVVTKKHHQLTAQLVCISKGNPKPVIQWKNSGKNKVEENANERHTAESRVDGNSDLNVGCCAKNSLGEECSKTYSYDLNRRAERHQIFLTSGQSLILQCKFYTELRRPNLKWHFKNKAVSGVSSVYFSNWMEYLSIESVNRTHSGEYTCKSNYNHNVTVHVEVFETDKIEILQMNENNSIMAQKKDSFCFQAMVFSHPKAQCHWSTPNETKIKCKETVHNDYNSTFELCNPEPGQSQIKLETRKYSVVRNLSVCISDIPKINISTNLSHVTCETQSSTPTALSWKTCPSHFKCFDSTDWKEFPVPIFQFPDSDQFCQKKIAFFRPYLYKENQLIKCCITNIAGTHCSEQILLQTHSYINYIIYIALIAILLLIIVALIMFIKLKKPVYQCQIQMIQMVGPNDNDYIYIDFKDFKYDQRWEFPRENLELGKQLGAGAFGMVVQATAYGISKPGVSLQVAVKMLKDKHQSLEKEALMSELKMLSYIGHHENIVNLLGACTGSGPVYLIFQYCCNGDLLNYLKSNRERFHKYLTDAFNRERFRSLYHNFQQKRNSSEFIEPNGNACLHVTLDTTGEQETQTLLSPSISSVATFEEMVKCDDKLQEEELQSLTYDDLLSFSFQVAKGMEFLSSKHCIHRDLAARNVLVTQGRQVKIGDFGLARDIDNDSNYVVKGNVRLPVKWMAPESIFKGVYTMQSDVWAYGILLWEIFSLGVTPYPGITVNNTFYTMIESGYHMEQPYYASESVYSVMCRCWSLNPADRPCFSKLVAFMEKELAALEQKLYQNFGGDDQNGIYQNSPVTLDATQMNEKQDVTGELLKMS